MNKATALLSLVEPAVVEPPRAPESATERVAITVAATFTLDPLLQPLHFWFERLGIDTDLQLAPYGQVIQQLLDAQGEFTHAAAGFNVIVIRLDDWISARLDQPVAENIQHVSHVIDALLQGVRGLQSRSAAQLLAFLCPTSSALPADYHEPLARLRRELNDRLAAVPHTHCWSHEDLTRLYTLTEYEDLVSDRLGHIPYTQQYFAAVATLLVRRITVVRHSRYKVIAVDCDNTLWHGVCGEVGASGIEITPAHVALHQLLIRQYEAGMLLCLCTKNNPDDVAAVFATRSDLLLRPEHFICSRVNWEAKSSNLRSMADELDLALDSFIFVDDNPLECTEVRTHCPSTLVLQFPQAADEIARFLDHTWAFDRVGITADARRRNDQYRESQARNAALAQATDLDSFLASLNLRVDITPLQPEQLTRVAELIQRTNQFNLTGIRRAASEIDRLTSTGEIECRTVHVKDRFGDYGLVGAILFRTSGAALDVDTLVLSCRALGRKVEHHIAEELGRLAVERGLTHVLLRFRRSERNAPAWIFLERNFSDFLTSTAGRPEAIEEIQLTIPTDHLRDLSSRSQAPVDVQTPSERAPTKSSATQTSASSHWHEIAYELSDLAVLLRSLDAPRAATNTSAVIEVAPRTHLEQAVAEIWADVLNLSTDEIDTNVDFFRLGGSSLSAVRTLSRIASSFGVELSVFDFFERPTVSAIAAKLASTTSASQGIERVARVTHSPPSGAQQRLWFIDRLEGAGAAYHIPVALRLRGELQPQALEAALNDLVSRHETLRTRFIDVGGEPMQEIMSCSLELQTRDLSALNLAEREIACTETLQTEFAVPFDLTVAPLIRGVLIRLDATDHVLLITMHHIVSDGWSANVLINDLAHLYGARVNQHAATLPELAIQFSDYVNWQRDRLGTAEARAQAQRWADHLRGGPELLQLPTDRVRPAVQSYRGASANIVIDAALTAELTALSNRQGATLAMTLLTAWSLLLAKLSGQDDIVIGMPSANRSHPDLEPLIGFFVNTIALRLQLQPQLSVSDALSIVRTEMVNALAHQDVAFDELVKALQPVRSLSHAPIFQVMFVFQNLPQAAHCFSGLQAQKLTVPLHMAHFDLTLSIEESDAGLRGALNYATDLIDAATIERWVACLEVILREMVRDSAQPLQLLPWLTAEERERVTRTFNDTQASYPHDKLLHQLFEEQATRTPNATAVVDETSSLSFAQLDERATQLAHYLRTRDVGPDRLVGIFLERSVDVLVAMLGTWKAGAAYVPLDSEYPPARLGRILREAAPQVIVTHSHVIHRMPPGVQSIVVLDRDAGQLSAQPRDHLAPSQVGVSSRNLVYTLFTSGSTGTPKGVMIEHHNVVSLLQGLEPIYQAHPCSRIAVNASISFDASIKQLIQLLRGRTVVIVPQECRTDPKLMMRFLREQRIDGIDCTPLQLHAWLNAGLLSEHAAHGPRVVLVGGEPIDPTLWETLSRSSKTVFYNVYGPTESTVDTTFTCISGDRAPPHIGHPMQNRQVYILDRHRQLQPIGIPGEMYIGGAGLARGYLNREDLTRARFVADTVSGERDARLYRTGDIARWRDDGTIEYLGRNDNQVKIRGYRIELDDIAAQLRSHSGVKEAAVLAPDDGHGGKRLVAYLTLQAQIDTPVTGVFQKYLKERLPEYMVPGTFVTLERLPLTANGKLDHRALPVPEASVDARTNGEPPRGETEQVIAKIWCALLRLHGVSRDDHFFELGGHSLLAAQVAARLGEQFAIDIPIRLLFEQPILKLLAAEISSRRHALLHMDEDSADPELKAWLDRASSMSEEEIEALLDQYAAEQTGIEILNQRAAPERPSSRPAS
jgi:amino acid adenylation domain-containing protein/FkbH-like protein